MGAGLPPELLDDIFSRLHIEGWEHSTGKVACGKSALNACSLVSRSWNAVAWPHLFRDILYSFRPVPDDDVPDDNEEYPSTNPLYANFGAGKEDARFKTFPMLFAFIQRTPLARNSIQRLRLEAWPRGASVTYLDSDNVDAQLLVSLLVSLPRLQVLHLGNVGVTQGPSRVSPLVHPSLKRLFIDSGSGVPDLRRLHFELDVGTILDCFTALEELYLNPLGLAATCTLAPNSPPLKIDRLILSSSLFLNDTLQNYLLEARQCQNICSLTLHFVNPGTAPDALASFGSHLEELCFPIPDPDRWGELDA
jgi:hypothetical protein